MRWYIIAKKEVKSALRDKIFYSLVLILWVLLVVSLTGSYINYKKTNADKSSAAKLFRQEWEEQQANPHSAAHFGTYLFKPASLISLFDKGLSNYTGTTYRVEAHEQHEMNYAIAQDSSSEMRFGELTVASIFQLLIPLIIIFLCFASVSKEKEGNTLKMLIAQGIKPSHILCGKVMGNYALIIAMVLPVFVLMGISLGLNPPTDALLTRMLAMILSYALYFFIITALVIVISSLAVNSRTSMLANLGVWMLFCVLLPRFSAGLADRVYALPSRSEFNKQVDDGFYKGINGDKSYRERWNDYEKKTLAKYKVDSVQNLPINFDGLAMQYGEDYQSMVYTKYAKEIETLINKQQQLQGWFSLGNPSLAMQQLSMAFAGTDYLHHAHFHKHAKKYRDEFIRVLNLDMAYSGSKYLTYDYQVGPDFFSKMKDFKYQIPSLSSILRNYVAFFCSLILWLLLVIAGVYFASVKIFENY